MVKALVCGSFDPITNGHLSLIARAARIFDHVVVGIFSNSQKRYMFSAEERADMVREACASANLDNVTVDCCSGMVAHYVRDNGIDVIVKGARNTVDFEYERTLDFGNKEVYEGAETVLLISDPKLGQISSTIVREFLKYGEDVSGLVPESVLKRLREKG
ncbi:MAG: pantetheine-phosphate adenylyltransferase [Clostridia bacterium]|nr:pantetheine-phosphate adenylyltransferase [Clostridia bacterium]